MDLRARRGDRADEQRAGTALRHAVIWRRISGGTDSSDGSRFVERMLTVVATCRQQKRNVLDYLSSCFEAHLRGRKVPSLLPANWPAIEIGKSHLRHLMNGYRPEYKLDGVRYKNDAYAMRQGDWADDYGYQIVEVANIADEKHSNIRTSINWSFGAFVVARRHLPGHPYHLGLLSLGSRPANQQADSLNQPASHASRSLTAGPDGLSRAAPSVSHEGSA